MALAVVDTLHRLYEEIVRNFFFLKDKGRESFFNEVSDRETIDALMLIEDEQDDSMVPPWPGCVDTMYLSYQNYILKHIRANFTDEEVSDRVINGALMFIEDEQLEEIQTLITPADIHQAPTTPTQGIQSSMAVRVSRHSIRGH